MRICALRDSTFLIPPSVERLDIHIVDSRGQPPGDSLWFAMLAPSSEVTRKLSQ
jgi:hypothetical protein